MFAAASAVLISAGAADDLAVRARQKARMVVVKSFMMGGEMLVLVWVVVARMLFV